MRPSAREQLIVGGGLAGGMIALELLSAGRQAVVLEKSKGPHDKVCGEFVSREALLYLSRHGIDVRALGGVPIRTVRMILRNASEEAELPFTALSITRRCLDEELLRMASLAGAEVQREAHVESLQHDRNHWLATLRDGRTCTAKNVFLATGKHDLRGWTRPEGTQPGLVGFKMYFKLKPSEHAALGHAVELILFPGGYAGLQPVEGGVANLCLLIDAAQLRAVGSSWAGVMAHLLQHSAHLAQRLQGAEPLLERPLAASRIPYGHVQRAAEDGLWRVGDQGAVVPSFCGDGMAIALHSGALAASHLLRGATSSMYQQELHHQLSRQVRLATGISRLLVGLPQAAQALRLFPSLLSKVAWMTRIPETALLAAAVERV